MGEGNHGRGCSVKPKFDWTKTSSFAYIKFKPPASFTPCSINIDLFIEVARAQAFVNN